MESNLRQALRKHAFWISLLAHSLFFMSLVTWVRLQPNQAPLLPASISAYAVSAAASPTPTVNTVQTPLTKPLAPPLKETKAIVEKPMKPSAAKPQQAAVVKKTINQHRAIRFSADSPPIDLTHPYDQEPLRLVGESNIVQPLVRILARAIGPHLFYPRVAAEFHLRGVVLIGFVLHPEGYLTDARIVKSSGAGVLDDAARNGVAAVATVGSVSEYVQQPEFLVIGVIFG